MYLSVSERVSYILAHFLLTAPMRDKQNSFHFTDEETGGSEGFLPKGIELVADRARIRNLGWMDFQTHLSPPLTAALVPPSPGVLRNKHQEVLSAYSGPGAILGPSLCILFCPWQPQEGVSPFHRRENEGSEGNGVAQSQSQTTHVSSPSSTSCPTPAPHLSRPPQSQ